ncbi:uncharacterized protein si:dkey-6e2.2 isoform X2 [Neoarius graeffei]|uniref:uncharacterized protein si:dkey-6e2.2 isoform X2 n=1 Tax=Neoarius graeffei TaxID=443677 RepID=UPI00298D062D|nr:uncharacterized protein si:dkey-6e2.2 isoform X2 [Neoarius graeffei]
MTCNCTAPNQKRFLETLMRPRKPNWSTEQKLLLVQLVKARREGLLTGRHSCRETATNRRWAWDEIAEEISTAYPDVPRTGKECERHWFIEQAKAREAMVNQKSPTEHINPVTKLVMEIFRLQRKDTEFGNRRTIEETTGRTSNFNHHLARLHPEKLEEDSTSCQEEEEEQMEVKYIPPTVTPFINMPENHTNNNSEDSVLASPLCPQSPSAEKKILEISVLRRQERVLQLQEEYYSLKIKHLKARMLMDL